MSTMKRRLAIQLGVISGLSLAMTACTDATKSPVPATPAASGGTVLIGGSIFTLQYPWFLGAQEGMQKWGNEHPDAKVKFQFEDSNQSIQTNIQKLEDLAAAGAKGIVVFPTDGKAIIPTMVDLHKRDITFVVGDYPQQPSTPDDKVWATFVGHDMKALGEQAGQVAVDYLKTTGKQDPTCLFITVPTSGAVSQMRLDGFKSVVLAAFPKARIIEEGDTGAKDRNSAQTLMENIMQREKAIDVVAGHNDAEVLGAYNAAVGAGRADQMRFVGIAGDKEVLNYITTGNKSWIGEVLQDPVLLGYTAMDSLWKAMQGQKLPDVTPLSKPEAITPANVSKYDWKNWKWLG